MKTLHVIGLGLVCLFAAEGAQAETLLLADIRRVVVTQDESGKTERTEEPIETSDDEKDTNHRKASHHHSSRGVIDLSGPADGPAELGWPSGEQSLSRFLSVGYSATHVFHKLTTRFNSPNFNSLSWDTVPTIRGQGVELAFHPFDLSAISLGFRGGYFEESHRANAQQQGSLYVQERVRTSGGWANLEAQTAPFWGLSFLAGVGGLTYSVDTQVETNAPAYRYEGLTGSRTVMIYGLGGQFEIPWKFPVKPFVQGRYWWTAGAGDPLENGIGQFNTGLTWRF